LQETIHDLSVSGYIIPIGWLQFANPIFVVIFAPVFAGIWTQLARKNLNPSLPIKFAFGLLLMALSFIVMLYAVELALVSSPVNMRWLILTYLIQTWGELALSPVGLAAFSRHSPKKYVGQMFGLWFTASAIGGVLAGLLGGDALVEGLDSISPVFGFMVQYYVIIAIALIIVSFLIGKTRGGKEGLGLVFFKLFKLQLLVLNASLRKPFFYCLPGSARPWPKLIQWTVLKSANSSSWIFIFPSAR
jgi:POT family proton-dependent oligopeptide transporter